MNLCFPPNDTTAGVSRFDSSFNKTSIPPCFATAITQFSFPISNPTTLMNKTHREPSRYQHTQSRKNPDLLLRPPICRSQSRGPPAPRTTPSHHRPRSHDSSTTALRTILAPPPSRADGFELAPRDNKTGPD
jgi:hypothetical protein